MIHYNSTNDWYVSNQVGVWNIVNNEGTDAFSVNIAAKIDYVKLVEDFNHLNFKQFKEYVESKWCSDARREYFKYVVLQGV